MSGQMYFAVLTAQFMHYILIQTNLGNPLRGIRNAYVNFLGTLIPDFSWIGLVVYSMIMELSYCKIFGYW